jgi:ADP-ribosylglycohydrolase
MTGGPPPKPKACETCIFRPFEFKSAIKSGGFVIDTLEAALWCFLTTDSYRAAVLKAVNLGEDTDTTAAVTGALAGLAYGIKAIPTIWLESLAGYGEINRLAGAMTAACSGSNAHTPAYLDQSCF